MIEYSDGDIFKSGADALVCPVNTVGTMGAGLALKFKRKFPWCAGPYGRAVRANKFSVGQVLAIASPGDPDFYVLHIATKTNWQNPSKLSWVSMGLDGLADWLRVTSVQSVAIPAMGSGLGGLPWDRVRAEIDRRMSGVTQRVIVYPPK